MKNKAIKREVKWLYRALLRNGGRVVSLSKTIGYYDKHAEYRDELQKDPDTPSTLKAKMQPVIAPQYLRWAKQYLVK